MHTETIEAVDWWARPRGVTAANWVGNYQSSLHARHRDLIAQIVAELQPETLFEVGCHCGPNLVRLAQEYPTLHSIGLDVSVEAVQAGRQWVARLGLSDRVQLNAGRFPDQTTAVATGAFDVVLSCYALAYIAPEDLDATLYEIGRLAARAVILAEPMVFDEAPPTESRSMSGYTEWAHNYARATEWIASLRGIRARSVPVFPPVDKMNAIYILERT